MDNNLYEILEVNEKSSIEEIKKAYRRLSIMYHPDKNKNNPEATAKFLKISEAYEILGDIDKKREYDMMRNNPFMKMMNNNTNVEDFFSNLFGGMQPFGMFNPHEANIHIFRNGVPINSQSFSKPIPIIKNLSVPIDKLFTGTTIPIDIERWIIQDGNKVFENETIYVTIPKGIDDGEIIILREKGNMLREDCKGDVKIIIKMINDTELKRSGLDIIYEKTISVKEALCGFSFELKYITGKTYTINNNSGNIISHGYRKVISNMGFSREQHVGNLIIIFNVKFPEMITKEVMEQLKSLEF